MDDALNSHRTILSSSCNTPRSLTSIANNMTSQAMSPQAKASLSSIENSYQNFKSKAPINQDMHRKRSERQGEVGKQLDPIVRPRLYQPTLSSSSCTSSRTVTMKTSNLRNVNSNITATTTTTTTTTAAASATTSTATKTPIAASSLTSIAAAATTITMASATSAATTTTTTAAAATTLSPPVAGHRNRRNVLYESRSTNKDYNQQDSKAETVVSVSPQMSSINLGAGENCMLDHLKVTDDCDSRLEELFKETSKLVKVANSTLRRNSHTSSVPISRLPTPDRNTPEPGFEPPIINSDARASKTPTKSTLSDLLETLKKLEEDEDIGAGDVPVKSTSRVSDLNESLKVGGGSNRSRCSSRSRCANKEGATLKTSPHLTAENLQQLNQDQHPLSPPDEGLGYLSNDKLQSIISFLDEVQSADRLTDIELAYASQ
ncbi:mucin-5AC-like [Octopus bimaculoides]|uniref:mucin-5AC-like n=1 Tax=Octopus bimaculoides TaxID=37653 RepID=UPI00071E65F2|nr:mucin-5AC-like [Octopus bimaculoides]|eukprot:XP_014772134.1 PREDICTED: mucin-5AC-like [Octopus bimaculoides]